MLVHEEVTLAVELQRKSYGLLRWITDAVGKGELTFSTAHDYATASESFREWLTTYTRQVPGKWRPRMSEPREVTFFANLFTSYLLTSFELVEAPGLRKTSEYGCSCELCSRLVASHLRVRTIGKAEKSRARELKLDCLKRLAGECARPLTDSLALTLIDGESTAEACSLATYGESLVARALGATGEPALLALWREFAWMSSGSPRRDFELTPELILESEALLVEELKSRAERRSP
jgi:hypothetical protein